MVDLSIEIPQEFLNEEYRCGYKVTREMKEVWAVELDLLAKLQSVCKKYNLTVLADSGTLLGAIRHKGFIPWDDDIDVVMLRKDYDVLLSVADKEFKDPYFFQTAYSEKNYIRAHAQLRNSNTTGCTIPDLTTSYNKGIFIDIFPLDNLPDDIKVRDKFIKKIRFRWKLIACPYLYHKSMLKRFASNIIGRIYPWGGLSLNMKSFVEDMMRLILIQSAMLLIARERRSISGSANGLIITILFLLNLLLLMFPMDMMQGLGKNMANI